MPIEFTCPSCQYLVRTPDTAAGKKGKCPQCQSIVQIPGVASSGKSPAPAKPAPAKPAAAAPQPAIEPSPVKKAAPAKPAVAPAKPAAPAGTLEFYCNSCGEVVRTPATAAGKKGKCPHCQSVVQIPGNREPAAARAPKPVVKEELGLAELPELGLAEDMGLAEEIQLPPPRLATPQPKVPTAKSAAPRAALQKQPAAKPKPAPKKPAAPANPGLTELAPLDELTPLDGLTPLPTDGLAELTPLGEDNLAVLAPLSDDPLAGISDAGRAVPSPLGNVASSYAPAVAKPIISDTHRRGLPWQRQADFDTFWETARLIISSPHTAFRTMRRGGGIGNAVGFLFSSQITAVLMSIAFLFVVQMIIVLIYQSQVGGNIQWGKLLGAYLLITILGLISATLTAGIGGLVAAGIYHVSLLACGGANAGFGATYRVVAFGLGSANILMAIPLVGWIIAPILQLVVLIFGLKDAHETSGGRAALAVLIPSLLALCVLSPMLLSLSAVMSAIFSQLGR